MQTSTKPDKLLLLERNELANEQQQQQQPNWLETNYQLEEDHQAETVAQIGED